MDKMFTEADIDYKSFNDTERSFVAFASKPVIDRDKEIISWDAWDLANYKKNPIVLWAHSYREMPVGKSLWIKRTQEGLKFKPAFADTEEGNKIYQLYKDQVLRAFSVGFIPTKWHDPGDDDEKDIEDSVETKKPLPRRIYDKVELLEVSCVPVPACPDALVEAYKEGKIKTKFIVDYIKEKVDIDEQEIDSEEITLDDMLDSEPFDSQKPYPNEHACRLTDPGKYDRLRRNNCFRRSDGKCIDYIFGVKGNKSEVQAMRYKKDVWTAAAARSHCKDAGGSFEAAASSSSVDESITISDTTDIYETTEGTVYATWEEESGNTIEVSNEEMDELARELDKDGDFVDITDDELHELAEWVLIRKSRQGKVKLLADEIAELKAALKVLRGGVG